MTIETKNKVLLASLVVAVLLGAAGLAKALGGGAFISVENGTFNFSGSSADVQVNNGGKLGSAQTSALHLTDANTLSSQDSLQLWGTGTGQGLEVAGVSWFTGALNASGTVSFAGAFTSATDTRVTSFVDTGAVVTLTTTTVLTPAQVCDAGVIVAKPGTDSGIDTFTITLPSSSTLFADCLTTNGDSLRVPISNLSSLTSTLLAVGTGGPSAASSTNFLIIQKGDTAMLELIRTSTIGYILKRL